MKGLEEEHTAQVKKNEASRVKWIQLGIDMQCKIHNDNGRLTRVSWFSFWGRRGVRWALKATWPTHHFYWNHESQIDIDGSSTFMGTTSKSPTSTASGSTTTSSLVRANEERVYAQLP